ncbi:Uncharacterised protein [uncultured archaeon]|nr:Uncharacterised protein [uncultured archaeon]
MKKVISIWMIGIFICSTIGVSILPSIVATDRQQNETIIESGDGFQTGKITSAPYTGRLRVYVVEPISRWNNYAGNPYHYGFLDFAMNEQLSLEYLGTYSKQVTWNAQEAGFSNVTENNIMVVAAVFSPFVNTSYANPPKKNEFVAHYIDAAAGATPGHPGSNSVKGNFTHTVFIEEATAQYCPYCPAMAEALNNISKSNDYPFYFAALVTKDPQHNVINSVALNYLVNTYNLYAYPSAFFDGGNRVIVGGSTDEKTYRKPIEACGKRDVHEMNLNISVVWKGNGIIDINVTIINNEIILNNQPSIPTLTGPNSVKLNKKYNYEVTTTDPEGDQVWYWIDWGDKNNTGWIGPFTSGTGTTESHIWTTKGNFTIKAKAKDMQDFQTDWATLITSVPYSYNIPTLSFWKQIFEQYPHAFPILRQLIGY